VPVGNSKVDARKNLPLTSNSLKLDPTVNYSNEATPTRLILSPLKFIKLCYNRYSTSMLNIEVVPCEKTKVQKDLIKMSIVWIAQGHANQRDVIRLVQEEITAARVIGSHSDDREDILAVAAASYREPKKVSGSAYAEWLLAACVENGVRALMAFRLREAVVTARSTYESFGIRVSGGAMTAAELDLTEHKDQFTQILQDECIPVPQTIAVRNGAEMRHAIAEIGTNHRVCVKPVIGVYGRGFWILSDEAQEIDPFLSTDDRVVSTGAFVRAYETSDRQEPFLVMEFLPGIEYSVDCVCDAGSMIAAASRRKETTYQIIETNGPQIELARQVAQIFNLDGLVNVQVKLNALGQPCVLEANTRPAGGVGFSSAAGINLPGLWARHALGLPFTVPHLSSPVAIRPVETPILLGKTTHLLADAAQDAA
jgi:carbamoylphosphate synthase large subunit